jgi:molybdate transport system substrate-binding protein
MFAATIQAADIKVMNDRPLEPALTKVVDLYCEQTHNQVSLVFDPSPVVKKRIEDGEAADVVIVQPDFAENLTKSGKLSAGDRPIIAHVGVDLNRQDGPAYDISAAEDGPPGTLSDRDADKQKAPH